MRSSIRLSHVNLFLKWRTDSRYCSRVVSVRRGADGPCPLGPLWDLAFSDRFRRQPQMAAALVLYAEPRADATREVEHVFVGVLGPRKLLAASPPTG
jgi:hypothetical protein